MKQSRAFGVAEIVFLAFALTLLAVHPPTAHAPAMAATGSVDATRPSAAAARTTNTIRMATFGTLPLTEQQRIASRSFTPPVLDGSHQVGQQAPSVPLTSLASRSAFESFSPLHRDLLIGYAQASERGIAPGVCFAPDANPLLVDAFQTAFELGRGGERYQNGPRWTSTAMTPGPLGQGDPVTLRYSFVPDGTHVSDIGLGAGVSDLTSFLNGIYFDSTIWRAIYDDAFALWGSLCGNTYILEVNDDGVPLHTDPGVVGQRGDLRMAGRLIDGNSGILAYNNFPQDGDMVIDTGDAFYSDTSSDHIRLRNVLGHEHGHGMGLFHVCPIEQKKLMEPFYSAAFRGPQNDDIQSAQRHYGDLLEPNDTSVTAAHIGTPPIGISLYENLSCDDNSDVDFFSFTAAIPGTASVTVRPVGETYQEGPQNGGGAPGGCTNSPIDYDSLRISDLGVAILDTNGSSILDSVDASPAGSAETATAVLPVAGTYYIRVTPDSTNNIQRYEIQMDLSDLPFIPVTIVLPSGPPTNMIPASPTEFDVRIIAGDDSLVGDPMLMYRFDDGAYIQSPLLVEDGEFYTASLPPPTCVDQPQFYITATGVMTGERTEPFDGATFPFNASVSSGSIVEFSDDFEEDLGWTVSGDATDGDWQRGVPPGNNRGDPDNDFDGSGLCFLTDIDDENGINNDVDNGTTILTSPLLDMSFGGIISYAYWLDAGPGSSLTGDFLAVEVATDQSSQNWTPVRNYTTGLDGWRTDIIDVEQEVGGTSTVRIRFLAADLGNPSIIEAGVDALDVTSLECIFGSACDGDADANGDVNTADLTYVIFRLGNSGAPGQVDGDVDGSGAVNSADITYVIFRLGPCT